METAILLARLLACVRALMVTICTFVLNAVWAFTCQYLCLFVWYLELSVGLLTSVRLAVCLRLSYVVLAARTVTLSHLARTPRQRSHLVLRQTGWLPLG